MIFSNQTTLFNKILIENMIELSYPVGRFMIIALFFPFGLPLSLW